MKPLSDTPSLQALSTTTLYTLQRESDLIRQEVTEGYFRLHPECNQANIDLIHKMCKTDCQHHLDFLLTALSTATVEIFSDYVHWLKTVMIDRNLSLQHSIDSFTLLKQAINARVDLKEQPLVNIILDQGCRL